MANAKPKPSTLKPVSENPAVEVDEAEQARLDAIDAAVKGDKELANELSGLTTGERLIRLRQRGLIDFDVQ